MQVQLIVAEGKRRGNIIPIKGAQFLIGRHKECQLKAASSMIGRHHCAILIRSNRVIVNDFDSVNGTLVNGERVQGQRELRNEDVLKVGPLVFLVWIEREGAAEYAFAVLLPETSSAADSSAIAGMLLSCKMASDDLLGVEEESGCGSTVLPSAARASPKESTKKRAKAPDSTSSGTAPPAVREMLDGYQRRTQV